MPKKKNKAVSIVEPGFMGKEPDAESRIVYFVGEVNEELVKTTVEKIVSLAESNPVSPITLIINTFGGEVYDTFMLYDMMKFIKTPIYTVGLGKVMSAGCLLLAAGAKGHRKIGRNAVVMYHCAWDHFGGNIFEMKARLKQFEIEERQYDECFAKETGLDIEQVEALYNKHGPTVDRYISSEECKRLNIVDEIIA